MKIRKKNREGVLIKETYCWNSMLIAGELVDEFAMVPKAVEDKIMVVLEAEGGEGIPLT